MGWAGYVVRRAVIRWPGGNIRMARVVGMARMFGVVVVIRLLGHGVRTCGYQFAGYSAQ